MTEKSKPTRVRASKKQKPQLVRLFCYVCKKHFNYVVTSPSDAHKRFDAMGHSDVKVARLSKDLGRGPKFTPTRFIQRRSN